MTGLAAFLLERIAEDEAHIEPTYHRFRDTNTRLPDGEAPACWVLLGAGDRVCIQPDGHLGDPSRIAAECEAKRRIVERCAAIDYAMPCTPLAHGVLSLLAEPYKSHPDFPVGGTE